MTTSPPLDRCPFCGKSDTLKVMAASELLTDDDEDAGPYLHTESYAVICNASKPNGPGGCGAQGGFMLSEAEAIAAWNRRAAQQAAPSQPPEDAASLWLITVRNEFRRLAAEANAIMVEHISTLHEAEQAAPSDVRDNDWKMPDAPDLYRFINDTPLVASLLYDTNLLPEQIDNPRHWNYMVAICSHMESALAASPPAQIGKETPDHLTSAASETVQAAGPSEAARGRCATSSWRSFSMCADANGYDAPYTVEEHDIPPGVTVCCVKDASGRIVRDGMHVDQAEAFAERMNEAAADDEAGLDGDEDPS